MIFHHDGIDFHYRETGHASGMPFIFQHGLGGDVNQPFGLFSPPERVRLLAFDCRAHGNTYPLGDVTGIGFATFADDLLAFMDHLRVSQAIVGGISMGAALALRFALCHPERVTGLVLSRPAWLDQPDPPNLRIYALIVRLIRNYGAAEGLVHFKETGEYQSVLRESPNAAASLVGQFQHPRAEEALVRLERIPLDTPVNGLRLLQGIHVPTLVLSNRQDPIHPFAYGETLAWAIPGAVFRELTPKSVCKDQHGLDVQREVEGFLEALSTAGASKSDRRYSAR